MSLPEKMYARRAHNARNGNYYSLRVVYPTSGLPGDRSSEFGRVRQERGGWNADAARVNMHPVRELPPYGFAVDWRGCRRATASSSSNDFTSRGNTGCMMLSRFDCANRQRHHRLAYRLPYSY